MNRSDPAGDTVQHDRHGRWRFIAFMVNAAILVLAAMVFYGASALPDGTRRSRQQPTGFESPI